MNDREMTISQLKAEVMALCRRKGWGEDGVQNPQHVAMAMTVEMSELLEHFQWLEPDQVEALLKGGDRERVAQIGEEFADVMMYGLQLCESLQIDLAGEILRKIEIVNRRKNGRNDVEQADET